MQEFINNNEYLKYALEDLVKLNNSKSNPNLNFDCISEKETLCHNVYEFVKNICNKKIQFDKEELAEYFHFNFENETDMLCYNTFVVLFVKHLNDILNKEIFHSLLNAGVDREKNINYTIRVDCR